MKNRYIAPEMTVVEMRVERGFASSLTSFADPIPMDMLWEQAQEISGVNATGQNIAGSNPLAGHFGQQEVGGNGSGGGWFGNSPWTSI